MIAPPNGGVLVREIYVNRFMEHNRNRGEFGMVIKKEGIFCKWKVKVKVNLTG
jgi:hypothetical protein